jgi:hypothetical protein
VKHVDYPNAPLVAMFVMFLRTPKHLRDDAFSEGLMALLEAERKSLRPRIVIKRRIIDFLRREGIGERGAKIRAMTRTVHGLKEWVRPGTRQIVWR